MDILCRLFTFPFYPFRLMHSTDHSPAVHQGFYINTSPVLVLLVTQEHDFDPGSGPAGGSLTRWLFMTSVRCISVKNVLG